MTAAIETSKLTKRYGNRSHGSTGGSAMCPANCRCTAS
jgi:hypothetical protein